MSIATSSFGRQKQYPCWRQCGFTFSLLTQCGLEVTLLGIRSQEAGGRRGQRGARRGQEEPGGAGMSQEEPRRAEESGGARRSRGELLLAPHGSSRLLLAPPGSSWLLLVPPGLFWPFLGPFFGHFFCFLFGTLGHIVVQFDPRHLCNFHPLKKQQKNI